MLSRQIQLSVGKQSVCGDNKEAAAACAAAATTSTASVAVWSTYRTTLSGISLRLWIWLRGIDRFLSRQMWFSAAPSVAEGRSGKEWGDWIAHARPPWTGNDSCLARCVEMKRRFDHFRRDLSNLRAKVFILFYFISSWIFTAILHDFKEKRKKERKRTAFPPTCWWMTRWAPCRCHTRPRPIAGPGSPRRTWSGSAACTRRFSPPLSGLQLWVWSHRWLPV